MLIIPEIESVVIQPPRTGSTSLRDAVLAHYPKAIQIYRHMERTGIPKGYERWKTYCLVREPFDRLVSIYNYMRDFRPTSKGGAGADPLWKARMKADVDRSFEDWLLHSTEVFTDPVQMDGAFMPFYNIDDPRPISKKSQFAWARPDLGPVELIDISRAEAVSARLGVSVKIANAAPRHVQPEMTEFVDLHIDLYFGWDRQVTRAHEHHEETLHAHA